MYDVFAIVVVDSLNARVCCKQAHMEPGQTHDFCVTLAGSKAMAERAAELLHGTLVCVQSHQ